VFFGDSITYQWKIADAKNRLSEPWNQRADQRRHAGALPAGFALIITVNTSTPTVRLWTSMAGSEGSSARTGFTPPRGLHSDTHLFQKEHECPGLLRGEAVFETQKGSLEVAKAQGRQRECASEGQRE
jgi:hypothetical protein